MKLCASSHTEIAWADGKECPMCALMARFEEGLRAVAKQEHLFGALGNTMNKTECEEEVEDRWPQIKKMGGL